MEKLKYRGLISLIGLIGLIGIPLADAVEIGSIASVPGKAVEAVAISDFQPVSRQLIDRGGGQLIAIRSFLRNKVPSYLVVDPRTLTTRVIPAAQVAAAPVAALSATTPYLLALERFGAGPYKLQNHGVTRATRPVPGCVLTVDLCPSRQPFEQELFRALLARQKSDAGPVPVAIAITGHWLERHSSELAWLKEQVALQRLAITWVNHSDSHPYVAGVPLERNFLLTPGSDLRREVLAVEAKLLVNDLVPSVFFRFPGLVSSAGLVKELRKLGLIPLGSDAWLAKGEQPRPGSFILVHGNGNEPAGIKKILELFKVSEKLPMLPLAAVVSGETN